MIEIVLWKWIPVVNYCYYFDYYQLLSDLISNLSKFSNTYRHQFAYGPTAQITNGTMHTQGATKLLITTVQVLINIGDFWVWQ